MPAVGQARALVACIGRRGYIYDPTREQFLRAGTVGEYVEFNGIIDCAECGKQVPEEKAQIDGNYAYCSGRCYANFVGIGDAYKDADS